MNGLRLAVARHNQSRGVEKTSTHLYRKTGKELAFVPMYIAPKLRKLYLGKPIYFHAAEPMDAPRSRICRYLMDEITGIAQALPEHTVVPYRNIPKKDYPSNIPKEGVHEKTGS